MFVTPLLFLVVVAAAIWGSFNPWPAAEPTLRTNAGYTPLLVGFRNDYNYIALSTGSYTSRRVSRTYLLVPPSLTWPKLVTVSQLNEEPPRVTEGSAGVVLISVAAVLIICIVAWWRHLRKAPEDAAA